MCINIAICKYFIMHYYYLADIKGKRQKTNQSRKLNSTSPHLIINNYYKHFGIHFQTLSVPVSHTQFYMNGIIHQFGNPLFSLNNILWTHFYII